MSYGPVRFAGLLAISLILRGQQAAPPQDPEKAAVEGQVLNAVTNEPLRKASLTLRMNVAAVANQRGQQPAAATYTVTSDALGKFAFGNVDLGDYQLIVRHDGFADTRLGNLGNGRKDEPILLGRGDRKGDLRVKMMPYGAIAGLVLDEDGDPIRNLRVSVMQYRYTSNGRELREVRSASSNDLGEYRIFDLPAGRYFIKINPPPFPDGPQADSYAPVFYPGVAQVTGAIAQDLTPGQQLRGLSFNLRKVHFATIRGKVIAPADATSVNVGRLIATENGSTSTSANTDDKSGKFEFRNVPPGFIYITGDYILNGKRHDAMIPVDVQGGDIDGLEIRPVPPGEVSGQVQVQGDPDFDVSKLRISLNGASSGHNDVSRSTVYQDGKLTITDITPGRYRVAVSRMQDFYIKSVQWGTTDVTDSQLDLLAGIPPRTELSIVLGADGGQIEGVVKNEKSEPCDGATVTLVPTGAHRSAAFHKRDVSDASGKFSLRGIAPGSYKLYAWDKVDPNAVTYDPEFLRPYEGAAQAIEILPRDKKTTELKLIVNKEE